ncbi:MAG TPA: L,D-transpeptidase family protein, partial [Steroidobacteraceae bacterium]
ISYRKRMNFRLLAALLAASFASVGLADELPGTTPAMLRSSDTSLPVVDRVVVHKAQRRLDLMHGGNVVRSYHVALGLNPTGQKERSGDFRTPEGDYRLDRRNSRSDYFLSIKVSYPNDTDMRRARARHWQAGGSIMIHGLPNLMKHDVDYYQRTDWTDGCIAVSNVDMVEIWMLTPDNAPIDILP